MDTYIQKMNLFRDAIDSFDEETVRSLIEEANKMYDAISLAFILTKFA